jgi:hypothetical protein
MNAHGFIEIVDLTTGHVLCVQREPGTEFLDNKWEDLTKIDTPDGPVWIEKGIDPSRIKLRREIAYSPVWGDLIANQMIEGPMTFRQACKHLGLPIALVSRWRREHEEFRNALDFGYRERAEGFHDKAIEIAKDATTRTVSRDTLEINTLKWAAEKGNPDKFGSKDTKAAPAQATVIVIDTGIRRPRDVGYVAPDIEIPAQPLAEAFDQSAQTAPVGVVEEDASPTPKGSSDALREVSDKE